MPRRVGSLGATPAPSSCASASTPRSIAAAPRYRVRVTKTANPLMHRHGGCVHSHPHAGPHRHLVTGFRVSTPVGAQGDHAHDGHGHTHGLVDDSVTRSQEGIRAVGLSLTILGVAAIAQTAVFVASGSIALLADLIHNFGDALTAVPLGMAFALRSRVAERRAGLAVVATIFISACVAGVEAVQRLIHPAAPSHLAILALAGAIGYAGNFAAARIRTRAGKRLGSPALVADGEHARADAYVSVAVIATAAVVALGAEIADPLIGLGMTLVILRIT